MTIHPYSGFRRRYSVMNMDMIIDDGPLLERKDWPKSHTWPILPAPPIEAMDKDEFFERMRMREAVF